MKIGALDTDREVLLIAEIGNNHEGDPRAALALAERALDCGAHIVKFQLIEPERLVSVEQTERVKQLSRFKLPVSVYQDIARRVHERRGIFMASAFDVDTLAAILPTLDAVKIASGDLDFDPLLALAAKSGKPVVLSTGMATLPEIEHAVATFRAALPVGARLEERLALLHCVSLYPTQPEQANLEGIATLRNKFGLVIGYSDHVLGIDVALMSLGAGARIIEKHFTLDKNTSAFRDHALAADPGEMSRLAALVRGAKRIIGGGAKDDSIADRASARAVRRSVVAARALGEGTVLAAADFDYVRPGEGLPPTRAAELIGRKLRRSLRRHELIRPEDVS
ncbi:MAG: N,N-diacetyllegionaminate synthase [Betaproteobacteria bacterium]|jgi:N-acetylneuraminate synthase/N,N'-diacetyllegionaminate synthase|nr:N,N-diacetyllegionaminate synthase [Betaproteobacteria bacterium]